MRSPSLIFGFLVVCFLVLVSLLFFKLPPVWPDEALFADISLNVLNQNRLGTDLLKGVINGVENHGFGYPPAFFYLSALWFKLLGFSILNFRLLSVVSSIAFLFILFYFLKSILKADKKLGNRLWFTALVFIPLIVDYTFLKSVRIARPEMIILLSGTLALLSIFKASKGQCSDKQRNFYSILSGTLISFTFLNHYSGIIFFLTALVYQIQVERKNIIKSLPFYLFLISFFLPITFWIYSILPYKDIFLEITLLQKVGKEATIDWLRLIFLSESLPLKLIYLGYILITWEFITFLVINKKGQYLFLGLYLLLSWFFALYWKHEFSFVYLGPFIYVALALLIIHSHTQFKIKDLTIHKLKLGIYVSIFVILFFLNFELQINNVIKTGGNKYSYDKFTESILKVIPDNKTVYILSIPDPYFGFKDHRNNKLYEYPMLRTKTENYLTLLNSSDYIVYNNPLDKLVFGNLVQSYIEKNSLKVDRIRDPYQYNVDIIELKPRGERVSPEIN